MIKNRPASADDEESEDEWEQGKPLTRKQTLIVAPAALLDQVRPLRGIKSVSNLH